MLRDGDRIAAVGSNPVTTWDALRSAIARHPDETVDLEITRDAHALHLAVTPDGRGSSA